ncbi:polysaccharide lyase family 7 protein [Nonomuraea jabiensis]|uniref:polysaccharide lyase family 7 protein n=1 Tax=Nonomuraea jabiensis TaxID=882448 RepID=UPI00342366BE
MYHLLVAPLLATALVVITPPASGVTASAHDGNVPANTVDNNSATRWSAAGDGQWISYDLGSTQTVGSVSLAVYRGDSRRNTFDLQVSTDGSSWTTVWSGQSSGTTASQVTYDFPDVQARHVRYLGHGSTASGNWNSLTEVDIHGPDSSGCGSPDQVLNLTDNWKLQLPVDNPDVSGTQPLEVFQPQLQTYAIDPWFTPNSACDGVRFRNAVNGVTTPNTSYARSELREMTGGGSSLASWSSTSGTHTLVIDQAITHLPNTKQHVVAGQIHDGNDRSVFRLEGSSLYVTRDNDTHYKLVTDNYTLGTRFQAKFVVSGGEIKAYYNNVLQATIPVSFTTGYFKAGVYTQANCTNSTPCSSDNYGEVEIYSVRVTHS